jgi:hypothetical protein
MARLLFSDYSLDEMTEKIRAANCIALSKANDGGRSAWSWNPAKLKLKPLEFTVASDRLQYARAFVLQVKREMHQPPCP